MENYENLSQDSRSLGRDFKLGPPKYEAVVKTLGHDVRIIVISSLVHVIETDFRLLFTIREQVVLHIEVDIPQYSV